MAITMGSEVALPLHLDHTVSYTDVERALTDAGFTEYIIMRTNNSDGSCDVQLFLRPGGGADTLQAGDTISALSDAISALDGGGDAAPA